MRILICGSRDWKDRAAIASGISGWLESRGFSLGSVFPLPVVVHGCAPGADLIAEQVAENWGFGVERHPALWQRYGKGAGPRRNQEMVDLGADVCLAFPLGASVGTRDCMEKARAAGIEVLDLGRA